MPPPLPRGKLSASRTSGSMALVTIFWTDWSWRSCPNSCHMPSPLIKQRLIDLLCGYQGGIDETKLPVHAEFQLLRQQGSFQNVAYLESHSLRKRGPCCLRHLEINQHPIQGGRSSHMLFWI